MLNRYEQNQIAHEMEMNRRAGHPVLKTPMAWACGAEEGSTLVITFNYCNGCVMAEMDENGRHTVVSGVCGFFRSPSNTLFDLIGAFEKELIGGGEIDREAMIKRFRPMVGIRA